ncbi:MAG: hypothetical protein H0W66_04945, partial [Chthoniobacterales bacterium]|nr:hypothetical protein [Chthoniobacterales bacterium]
PDFRGPQGVWTRRQPVYYQDFMTSEAARIEHWDYKLEAWESFRNAQPNEVHHAIVSLEKAHKLRMVVTQNIDACTASRERARRDWLSCMAPIRLSNARAANAGAIRSRTSIFFGRSAPRRFANAAGS